MKARNLLFAGIGLALTLGLSACDKGDVASEKTSATQTSTAPVASVAVEGAGAGVDVVKVAATAPAGGGAPNPAGEKVFKTVCFMCHQTGAAGAPMFGNKADWAPRIAQGKATLYKHALGGFTGNNGTMPPRGGNPSLKDDEVKAAVDFMVAKVQ
ncbi:MAG: cytochrome c5 family protein [Paraburkholderia sp.]|uniref:c-type cytochrome n=1 Tax=Paraburkholderia sp. TaxID=1926495 RepID=UPI0011FE8260|nr:c-type cytochrome [Paraburkholderia sp.]TAM07539.1 MAG: cytochrome c5 family protein [Paraburkholderia sp.]TAM54519.1 MAG: cytochrome c5 family protein [Paraburkholderia sp.]